MNILDITGRKRESYKVEVEYSTLWECALGIAAITNTPLLDTLEKQSDFENLRNEMSDELLAELDYVEANNTWKSLLQLLHAHEKNSNDIEKFKGYVNSLSEEELKYICLPYCGTELQSKRKLAAKGERASVDFMKQATKQSNYLPAYVEFISQINVFELKKHLLSVMSLWYKTVIQALADQLTLIFKRDFEQKSSMKEKLTAEEFVAWATDGTDYAPEPSVHKVLLIPQLTYRPWTVMSDLEETKVFYYPVSNESIHPEDTYLPDYFLTQKYKALGDEVRLRIIKLLSEHDCTLQEITEQFELGKSTVHHHLKILRAATLVEIKASKYCLKENSIMSLSKELELYLTNERL